MKKWIITLAISLLSATSWAQGINPITPPANWLIQVLDPANANPSNLYAAVSGIKSSFPPSGCVTANGVIFNNATPCDSGFTYAGSGGAVALTGILQLPDTSSATAGVIQFGGARFLHDQNATSNVFLGHNAYNFTGTPTTSVCVGESCMLSATGGAGNTCVGRFCMGGALSGAGNTSLGNAAMNAVTSGGANVAIGQSSNGVTTASNTTCVGTSSCAAVTGAGNTAVGFQAGTAVTGINNTFLGHTAGSSITSSAGNTIIGQGCTGTAGDAATIVIGNAGCVAKLDFGKTTASVWTFLGGTIALPATTNSTHTDATLCRDTTSGQVFFGSGTGGICLGTSGRQFKRDITEIDDINLDQIIALKPSRYWNRKDSGLDPDRRQVGLIADEVRDVLPDCATDKTVDYLCVSVIALKAIKQLAAEVAELKVRH